MSSVTLEQVRDWHRRESWLCNSHKCVFGADAAHRVHWAEKEKLHGDMADAIDAHLAGMGEPVAFTTSSMDVVFLPGKYLGNGVYLYTAPPIDLAAVREVVLPEDVIDALEMMDCTWRRYDFAKHTIRAYLMSQDAKLAQLEQDNINSQFDYVSLRRRTDLAESRLAAADALLRRCQGNVPDALGCDVYDHLQGAGDEA